jgi:hypothetical protein
MCQAMRLFMVSVPSVREEAFRAATSSDIERAYVQGLLMHDKTDTTLTTASTRRLKNEPPSTARSSASLTGWSCEWFIFLSFV